MLKRKLQQNKPPDDPKTPKITELPGAIVSEKFTQPFWMEFNANECALNEELAKIDKPTGITCIYNPLEYACSLHCAYLRRYLSGPKTVMFVGMNPGPNGMGQTGVSIESSNIYLISFNILFEGTFWQRSYCTRYYATHWRGKPTSCGSSQKTCEWIEMQCWRTKWCASLGVIRTLIRW